MASSSVSPLSHSFNKWAAGSLFLFAVANLISQSAMDLFATLFLAVFWIGVARGVWHVRWTPKEKKLSVLVGASVLVIALGIYLGSSEVEIPAWKKIVDAKWWILAWSIGCYLSQTRVVLRYFDSLFWSLVFASAFAVLIFFLGFNPLEPNFVLDRFADGTVRTGGFHGQPIVFAQLYGLWAAFLAGMWIHQAFSHQTRWQDLANVRALAFVITSAAILLSFTRGVWFSLPLALIFVLFLRRKSWGVAGLGAVGVSGFSLSLFWPAFESRIFQALQGGDSERIWIWKANWQMFLENPWLGVGYSHNTERISEYYEKLGAPLGLLESHAHNQFLHILTGTGVIGFLIYIAIWVYLFHLAFSNWKVWRDHPFKGALAFGVLAALVEFHLGGLFESNFEHSKIRSSLALLVGITFWLNRPENSSSRAAPGPGIR